MMQKATTEPASAPAGKHSPQSVPLATSEARTKDEKNRTMKTQPWLEGGGLAMLYLLPLIAIFLAPEQNGFYHQVMPVTSLTRGALIDLLVVGFFFGPHRSRPGPTNRGARAHPTWCRRKRRR